MREKLLFHKIFFLSFCQSPACAGKTLPEQASYLHQRDHPRVCGKNVTIAALEMSWVGSPPRVREKRARGHLKNSRRRITPASAGKTQIDLIPYFHAQDHPRECGKNWSSSTGRSASGGSPPRVREKLVLLVVIIKSLRITPASAGKTSCVLSSGLRDRDHPRMCGKNHKANTSICVCLGSPPRVREKLISSNSSSRNTRITPACAGKTHRWQI